VAKTPAGKVIKLHFGNKLRVQWLPFRRAFGAPAGSSTWRIACEPRRFDQFLKFSSQCRPILGMHRRREPYMIEFALIVVEAEKQGADQRFLFEIAETSNHAIRGTLLFNLPHSCALAGLIRQVATELLIRTRAPIGCVSRHGCWQNNLSWTQLHLNQW
jgi:hypothetical protein